VNTRPEVVPLIDHPDQYAGEERVAIVATHAASPGSGAAAEARRLRSWIEFLSTRPTAITDLRLASRVGQELLAAVAAQGQLRSLGVKWGPYDDLSPVARLSSLETLDLQGASRVESLTPLLGMARLTQLTLSQVHRVPDVAVLGELAGVTSLTLGNVSPGSDTGLTVPHLRWVPRLRQLRCLSLPGTRLLDHDLTPLLDLPDLVELTLPLRRSYRRQVFALADRSPVFASLAAEYESYDAWRAASRT